MIRLSELKLPLDASFDPPDAASPAPVAPAALFDLIVATLGLPATALPAERFGVQSQWFEIQGLLTRTDLDMQARALVRRQDVSVRLTRLQFEPPTSTRPSKVP